MRRGRREREPQRRCMLVVFDERSGIRRGGMSLAYDRNPGGDGRDGAPLRADRSGLGQALALRARSEDSHIEQGRGMVPARSAVHRLTRFEAPCTGEERLGEVEHQVGGDDEDEETTLPVSCQHSSPRRPHTRITRAGRATGQRHPPISAPRYPRVSPEQTNIDSSAAQGDMNPLVSALQSLAGRPR